jgi:hypothetical protein
MKKYLFLFMLIPSIVQAQQSVLMDIQNKQNDISNQNLAITQDQGNINSENADIAYRQSQIATDNAAIATDTQENAQYMASTAQTASGVNWDYFVTLEPQIPFATWSKVDSGINWTSIIPTLGITCGGITEANVNWNNWGTCEANGMTPGLPFGGKNTGIAAFWCGNGKIAGTC